MAKTSSKKSKKQILSCEDIAMEAMTMRSQGYSYKEIADSLNVEISKVYNAVYYYNRKANVPKRKYTRKPLMKTNTTAEVSPSVTMGFSFWSTLKSIIMFPVSYFTSLMSK